MTSIRTLVAALLVLLGAATLPAQDKLVKDALTVIAKYEALEPGLAAGDVATANRHLNALGRAGKRLGAAYDKTTVHWKDAAARYNALLEKIRAKAGMAAPAARGGASYDRRALEALDGAIGKTMHRLEGFRITDLDDAARVQGFREAIVDYRLKLAPFPAEDADVKTVAGNVDALEKLLDLGLAKLEAMRAPAGAKERLDAITELYRNHGQLQPLEGELEPERVHAWAEQVRRLRDDQMPRDLAWLDAMRGKVGLDFQHWQRVRGWVASSWPLRIQGLLEQNMGLIYGPERSGMMAIDSVLRIDPKDAHQVKNRVLLEGSFDENMQRLRDALRAIEIADAYDRGLGREDAPDRAEARRKGESAIEHLRACARTALADVRMPKAQSEDAELLGIAAGVLRGSKSGTREWKRMVVNYDKHRNEKKEGTITPGTVSATITVHHYVWDEFQVATAEPVDGTWWIFFNRFKYYHQGSPTTVRGRWFLADRFKSTPILEENIGR